MLTDVLTAAIARLRKDGQADMPHEIDDDLRRQVEDDLQHQIEELLRADGEQAALLRGDIAEVLRRMARSARRCKKSSPPETRRRRTSWLGGWRGWRWNSASSRAW
ncbi:hypothetical protein [Nonomuraea aurantiaca]|uniref:hypothetical protein n=1 Tax=Nonomuraea aurantiaca TaxID=2878562 RepID=UPI001CD959E2|nr:hypothetical protein [Nonomuraea aurantiaca]MCA2228303.1 hypothetical protein [Nonomuraea aurantiaca]